MRLLEQVTPKRKLLNDLLDLNLLPVLPRAEWTQRKHVDHCDEAKARLDISEKDKLGEFYDYEVMDVDEQSNLQLIMYASLAKGMPKDEPKLNRRDLAAKGIGILLTDIALIQEKLGTCTCPARKIAS